MDGAAEVCKVSSPSTVLHKKKTENDIKKFYTSHQQQQLSSKVCSNIYKYFSVASRYAIEKSVYKNKTPPSFQPSILH